MKKEIKVKKLDTFKKNVCVHGYDLWYCPNFPWMFTAVLFITVKTWEQPGGVSVGKWISKLWYIWTRDDYAAAPWSHVKMGRKPECILLRERHQSEKAIQCTIPTIWRSEKGTTMKQSKKFSGCLGLGIRMNRERTKRVFRATKILCMVLNDGYTSVYICPNP